MKDTDFFSNILVQKLDNSMNFSSVLNLIQSNENENKIPAETYKAKVKNITIFLDLDKVDTYIKFFEQAKNKGMTSAKYHYLLVTLVIFFKQFEKEEKI